MSCRHRARDCVVLGIVFVSVTAHARLCSGVDAPQTQDLKGEVVTENNEPIAGAICTLTGGILPPDGVSATTGERGGFAFQGLVPGTYNLACASVGFQLLSKGGIEVTDGQAPFLQMVLPTEKLVKQTVEVREKAP